MTRPSIIPGVTIEVVAPNRPGPYLKAPWLLIEGPAGSSLSTPPMTRRSAAGLRALADEVDAAWAKMDRQVELDAQPEDRTQFTALNPEEDAAMDNLAAGLPAFAPRVED